MPSKRTYTAWSRRLASTFLLLTAGAALFPELLCSSRYEQQFREYASVKPCGRFPLGTDELGRDRLCRLLYGIRVSLLLAPAAALVATTIALACGLLGGYCGGSVQRLMLGGTDLFASVPSILLLFTARAMLPLNLDPVISVCFTFLLLGLLGWTSAVARSPGSGCEDEGLGFRFAGQGLRMQTVSTDLPAHRSCHSSGGYGAVLAVNANFSSGGSKPGNAWAWCERAASFVGKFACRVTNGAPDLRGAVALNAGRPIAAFPAQHANRSRKGILVVMKLLSLVLIAFSLSAESELRVCLRNDPKTFDPHLTDEESGETVRYLTAGVLIRANRVTQQLEPELATAWKLSDGGRRITFTLRKGVRFSDGTAFTAHDVAFTVRRMMAPEVHSPVGDSFRSGSGEVRAIVHSPEQVSIVFPSLIAGLERLFDQVAILSAASPLKEKAVLGPFVVSEHKAGSYVLLRRNLNFWQRDAQGRRLPYLDAIRLDIQANRDIETLRFRRRELHMISGLDPVTFEQLKREDPSRVLDAGSTQDNEMLWFNQVKRAPLPEYKKAWFASQSFRRAVSTAINRNDIVRLVYAGHAKPAVGPFSEANKVWYNSALKAERYAPEAALRAPREGRIYSKGQPTFRPLGSCCRVVLNHQFRQQSPYTHSLIAATGSRGNRHSAHHRCSRFSRFAGANHSNLLLRSLLARVDERG